MKLWKRTTAGIFAAAILCGALPANTPVQDLFSGVVLTAHAEWSGKNADNTTLGTDGISAPKAPEEDSDPWTGNYVYYGKYTDGIRCKNKPVKYRVLDPNTSVFGGTTMLLDCDTVLFNYSFREFWRAANANEWTKSDLYKVLNTNDDAFLNTAFTDAESAAIAESIRETHALVEGSEAGNVTYATKEIMLIIRP